MDQAIDMTAACEKAFEDYLSGQIREANSLQQLLHLHREDPDVLQAALCKKVGAVVANCEAGLPAIRAGMQLVNAAIFLDGHSAPAAGATSEALVPATGDKPAAYCQGGVCRNLLDTVLQLTGAPKRGAKEKYGRSLGCTLIAALVAHTPVHAAAEAKLLEYSLDKLPSIREKAVRGLGGLAHSEVIERALVMRTRDLCTAIRASAVLSLRVSARTAAALLERLDDTEACVRAQVFNRLMAQTEAIDDFGPAAFAKLVCGLVDRSNSVRSAAGIAMDSWHKRFGGVLPLLARCDVLEDEDLGEVVAGALSSRFAKESARVAKEWLGGSCGRGRPSEEVVSAPTALLARLALGAMREDDRDELLDAPALIRQSHLMLDRAARKDNNTQAGFILRQLLYIALGMDICDEGLLRQFQQLAEAVMARAPLTSLKDIYSRSRSGQILGGVDLGLLLLRKCTGIGFGSQAARRQGLESRCSARAVLLISDLSQPFEETDAGDEDVSFTIRLSRKLGELNELAEELQQVKNSFAKRKKEAILAEDFMKAHQLKDEAIKNAKELGEVQAERSRVKAERDGHCLRILAILTAVLRFTKSDIHRDPALLGTFNGVLQPTILLPAISPEVEVAALQAIGLFCTHNAAMARGHWSLLTLLLRKLGDGDTKDEARQKDRACASVAARTLVDCARLHRGFEGEDGLDSAELMGAGMALAKVPFAERDIVVEPLCSWVLGCGDLFFEEHLREPVLEVQWALGWLLTEGFAQRGDIDEAEDGEEAMSVGSADEGLAGKVMQLRQFFSLLPRLAGQHGSPLLSLALESVAESGLWRRAALMPQNDGDKVRWTRGFSWPSLFGFVHSRVGEELRFRLWRCALQLCVTSPELAPFAEVPLALCDVAEEAPPGAAQLVQAAIALGADKDALLPLRQRLPQTADEDHAVVKLLMPQQDAEAAEQARRVALAEVGIDVDSWAGAITLEAPREKLRSRRPAPVKEEKTGAVISRKQGRRHAGAPAGAPAVEVAPSQPELPLLPEIEAPAKSCAVAKGASEASEPVHSLEPKRRKKGGKAKDGEVGISSKSAPKAHGA